MSSDPEDGRRDESVLLDSGYLDLTYSTERAPESDYPSLLARHVAARF